MAESPPADQQRFEEHMHWRLIFALAGVAVVLQLSIFLFPIFGAFQALGLVLIAPLVLGYGAQRRLFVHGFVTSTIAIVFSAVTGDLLRGFGNRSLFELAQNLGPWWFIGASVMVMSVSGLIVGLLTVLAARLFGKKPQRRRVLVTGPTFALSSVGLLVGGLIAFIGRPATPLVGQLPFGIVITAGAFLQGADQVFRGTAQSSFILLVAGAVIGALAGFVIGYYFAPVRGSSSVPPTRPTGPTG